VVGFLTVYSFIYLVKVTYLFGILTLYSFIYLLKVTYLFLVLVFNSVSKEIDRVINFSLIYFHLLILSSLIRVFNLILFVFSQEFDNHKSYKNLGLNCRSTLSVRNISPPEKIIFLSYLYVRMFLTGVNQSTAVNQSTTFNLCLEDNTMATYLYLLIVYINIMRRADMMASCSDEEMAYLLDGDWCGFEPAGGGGKDQPTNSDPAITDPAIMDTDDTPGPPLAVSSPRRDDEVNVNLQNKYMPAPTLSVYESCGTSRFSGTDQESSTMGATYLQCRNARTATLTASMHDVSANSSQGSVKVIQEDRVGSLDANDDVDLRKTFRGTRICAGGTTVNQNMSATFDPHTLICTTCTVPHSIVPTDGSGFVFILSDQNFATALSGNYNCVPIVRIEDASLDELFSMGKEILDRQPIPPGTLFLVGSTSYLAKVGTTIYAIEWLNLVQKFADRWRIGMVGPCPPVVRENCAGTVTRQLVELRTWYDELYGSNIEYPRAAWMQVTNILAGQVPDTEFSSQEIYTVPLPSSFANPRLRPAKFVVSSSTAVTAGFDDGATGELLRALLTTLTEIFNCKAHPGGILVRELAEQEGANDIPNGKPALLVLGGSHSRILATELATRGYVIKDLSVPGWIPTDANIAKLDENLAKIENLENYTVVLDFVSNYVFRFEQMDGQLAFPYKVGGRYHMLSKVTTCSTDSLVAVLDKLNNVMGRLTGPKVCLPPLPRYLHSGCCEEEGHCEGVDLPTHASDLLGKCQGIRKSLKEYMVSKYSGVWVPDTIQQMLPECNNLGSVANGLRDLYARDNVHLTKQGYSKVADIVEDCIQNKLSAAVSVSGPQGVHLGEKPLSFFWRGFVSPVGSDRPKEKFFSQKHKRFSGGHLRPGPYSGVRGGRGGGGCKMPPSSLPPRGRKRF